MLLNKKLYEADADTFSKITIGLASPEMIIERSHGEVTKPETINYRCLLYTSPSPRDLSTSRMPSSA